MGVTASDLMRREPHVVHPNTTLPELDRLFVSHSVSGFPVTDGEKLVGVVSRSDVVRQIAVEHSRSELLSGFYSDEVELHAQVSEELDEIAARVGRRIDHLCVRDLMNSAALTAAPDDPPDQVARLLTENHIHRVPVVEGGVLVGVISSSDFVRLIADGRARFD